MTDDERLELERELKRRDSQLADAAGEILALQKRIEELERERHEARDWINRACNSAIEQQKRITELERELRGGNYD